MLRLGSPACRKHTDRCFRDTGTLVASSIFPANDDQIIDGIIQTERVLYVIVFLEKFDSLMIIQVEKSFFGSDMKSLGKFVYADYCVVDFSFHFIHGKISCLGFSTSKTYD
jgi:hypothetical protein